MPRNMRAPRGCISNGIGAISLRSRSSSTPPRHRFGQARLRAGFRVRRARQPALSPAFVRDRTLCFNLSHSAGWAMFALARDCEVGIDLECAARLNRDADGLAGLAARVLTARELAIWQGLPETAREDAFLRAWTRKEAYTKATGQGLLDELIYTDVALDAAAPKTSLTLRSPGEGEIARDWVLHDLPAPDGFAAAIAVEQKLAEPA